jgi:hypothetical protein
LKGTQQNWRSDRSLWIFVAIAGGVGVLLMAALLLFGGKGTPGGAQSPTSTTSAATQSTSATQNLLVADPSAGYYHGGNVRPDLYEEYLTVEIHEMYYTKNDHLYVQMVVGNGKDAPKRLEWVNVKIVNGMTNEVIAEQYVDLSDKGFIVPAEGTMDYTCYVKPINIKKLDDKLDAVVNQITLKGKVV